MYTLLLILLVRYSTMEMTSIIIIGKDSKESSCGSKSKELTFEAKKYSCQWAYLHIFHLCIWNLSQL